VRYVLAVLLLLGLAGPAAALTAAEEAEVERLRAYLTDLTTMEATFQQVDNNGNIASGEFWLHRPHRLRFEYDPPNPILIVARGSFLVHYDKELNETQYLDQDDTPAWFLLSEQVQIGNEITVENVSREGAYISITARQTGREDQGAITLIFRHDPIQLVGWRMTDQAGNQVRLSLTAQETGGEIDPELFQFRPTEYE